MKKTRSDLLIICFLFCFVMPLIISHAFYKDLVLAEYSKWKLGQKVELNEKAYSISDDGFIRKNTSSKVLVLGYFLDYEDIIQVSSDNDNFIQFFRYQFATNSKIISVGVCDFLFIHKINDYKEIVWFNKQLKLKFQMKSKQIDQTHFSRLCNLMSTREHFS